MPMSFSTATSSSLPFPSGGGLVALVEFVLSFLTREKLTPEERELLERVRALTGTFGAYILEADDRNDLLARVDAVLEDPQFHTSYRNTVKGHTVAHFRAIAAEIEGIADEDVPHLGMAQALGPAALPHLRQLHRNMVAFTGCVNRLLASAPPSEEFDSSSATSEEPLAFITAPGVPIPVAEALLAGFRLQALFLSVGALRFHQCTAERWLGLAVAELLVQESRRFLAFMVALTGTEVDASLLPPEERLDLHSLQLNAVAVEKAYARFNTVAEQSGEPVFPASS